MKMASRKVPIIAATALLFSGSCSEDVGQVSRTDPLPRPLSQRIEPNQRTILLEDPLFRAGGSEATGPTAFGRVNGGVIDAQGRFWVADDMAGHIVLLDRGGTVADVFGRKGSGPGEFFQVEILGWKDTQVVAYDVEQRRTVLIDPAADSSVTVSLAPRRRDGVPRHIKGMGSRGETVFIPLDQPGEGRVVAGWAEYPPVRVGVEGLNGVDSFLLSGSLAVETYIDGRDLRRHPLQTVVDARVCADTVVLVGTMGGDVLVSTLDGTGSHAFNWDSQPGLEVGDETERWVQEFIEELPPERQRLYLTAHQVRERGLPPRRPFYDRLVFSTDGVMWVRRTEDVAAETRRWDVITLDGVHLGTAYLPSGENVLAASPTLVGTLSRDEMDAQVVWLYEHPFRRNGGGTEGGAENGLKEGR